MSTTFSYNYVPLDYILHTDFSEEVVYADSERTQYWYTKFRVGVQAIIHPLLLPQSYGVEGFPSFGADFDAVARAHTGDAVNGVAGDILPADIEAHIRNLLWQPRKPLKIVTGLSTNAGGGSTILSSPSSGDVDAANGPIPISLRIKRMNFGCFEVHFTVETAVVEGSNPTTGASRPRVAEYASNRYSDTDVIDADFITTRTRRGTVHVWSDGIASLDTVRARVISKVPDGHQRISTRWAPRPGNLIADYEYTDRECAGYGLPPNGTVSASGRFEESYSFGIQTTPFRTIGISLSLTGKNDTGFGQGANKVSAKRALLGQALRLCAAQIKASVTDQTKLGGFSVQVAEELYANKVHVTMMGKYSLTGTSVFQGIPIVSSVFGRPAAGFQGAFTPDPGTIGTDVLVSDPPQFFDLNARAPEIHNPQDGGAGGGGGGQNQPGGDNDPPIGG